MRYAGKCKAGHAFEGNLEPPKGHAAPASFADRCPVPYCPHFITYKPKEVMNIEEALQEEIVNNLHSVVDECNILIRQMVGVSGYEPVELEDVRKALKRQQEKFKGLLKQFPPK